MKVLVNNIMPLTIKEPHIMVREGKLYNTETQLFEGVQGDAVWFLIDKGGWYVSKQGIVEGYTCNRKIKLIGTDNEFTSYNEHKRIEHLSTVKVIDDEEELLAATEAL